MSSMYGGRMDVCFKHNLAVLAYQLAVLGLIDDAGEYLNELIVNFLFSFPLAYCAFASFFLYVFAYSF